MADSPMSQTALQDALAASQQEVESLREELGQTNRGVLALYAELESQADQLREATAEKPVFWPI